MTAIAAVVQFVHASNGAWAQMGPEVNVQWLALPGFWGLGDSLILLPFDALLTQPCLVLEISPPIAMRS